MSVRTSPPSEAELIEAEAMVSYLERRNLTVKTDGVSDNEKHAALNAWRKRDIGISTLRRLIDFARENR